VYHDEFHASAMALGPIGSAASNWVLRARFLWRGNSAERQGRIPAAVVDAGAQRMSRALWKPRSEMSNVKKKNFLERHEEVGSNGCDSHG
jgi:hypothetical protein